MSTPKGKFCCLDHAVKHGKDGVLKTKNKQDMQKRTDQKRKDRAKLEELKTLNDLIAEAQKAFNAFVRIRDFDKPCVSCGRLPGQKRGGTVDCGHYRSRGAAGHLRFNLMNAHSQCVYCNRHLGGNYSEYRIGLIGRIGLDRVERLEQDNRTVKWSKDYVRRVREIFRKRTRLYKKRFRQGE